MRYGTWNHRKQAAAALIALALWPTCAPAIEMPTLADPFLTQKKLAPYGENLKPAQCPTAPDTSKALGLGDVVIATLCHNPDARSAYLSLLASADSYDGTIMSFLPDVTATATGSSTRTRVEDAGKPTFSRSSGVSASSSLTLYDFGRREASLAIAERTLVTAGLTYDSALQGFIATSLQQYFKLLTSQNAVAIEKLSYELAQATLDAAETRYKLGIVAIADVLQARTAHAQAALSLETAKNSLAIDRAALAQLIGQPPFTELRVEEMEDVDLQAPPFKAALMELIAQAKEQRTDLKSKQLSLQNARDSFKNTQRRGLPTISASASSSFDDWDLRNRETLRSDSIGVSVSIPIFTGFSRVFSERAERKQLESQELDLIQTERNVEQDVLKSWQNYHTSSASYDISRGSLGTARQLKEVALGRYKEGLGSILDLISAQNSYRSALQSHLSARYSLLTSRVDLVRSVGALDLNSMQPPTMDLPPLAAVVSYVDPFTNAKNQESAHETP